MYSGINLYEVLGFEDWGEDFTEKELKKKYRKFALKYHPDKLGKDYDEQAKKKWLKIQEAWEVLNNQETRRRYDSSLEFDDTIPEDFDPAVDEFYGEFGRIFKKNSRWSVKKNVPNLGDENTTIKKVFKFYEFWEKFDTWRDFVHKEEYDYAEAENRYEKRWMEKENKKLKNKMYKKERIRLNRLVNLSQDFDPRIIAWRKEEEDKKQKIKDEQKARKNQKREKEQAIKDKQKQDKIDKIANELKKKEDMKMKKKNQAEEKVIIAAKFKEVFLEKVSEGKMDKWYANEIIRKMRDEELKQLTDVMESGEVSTCAQFKDKIEAQLVFRKQKTVVEKEIKVAKIAEESTEREWTDEEKRLLPRAVVKFPSGTHQRWNRVAAFLGGRLTEQEVIAYAKKMKDVIKKGKGSSKINLYQVNQSKMLSKKKNSSDDPLAWSQEQQDELQKSIKAIPKTLPAKERWEKIAEGVSGKNMKECVGRFKELKKAFLLKKKQNKK